jgi:hypothetical protein
MLYGMCINGFEAWKFQNACCCHGNRKEDFCIWRPFYILVTMATAAILKFFQPPKAATYYGGYSYKVDHNMAPKPWISIPNIKIYLETKFRPSIDIHHWFAMVAILNPKWPPKYKNPPIWAKFDFQVDYDDAN